MPKLALEIKGKAKSTREKKDEPALQKSVTLPKKQK